MSGDGHQHSAQCGCSHEARELDIDRGDTYLFGAIDTTKVWALNAVGDDATLCLKTYEDRLSTARVLCSEEDDADLILFIPFTRQVIIKSLSIVAADAEAQPTSVSVYTNRDDLDFTNVDDVAATQRFDLHYDPEGQAWYPTRVNKFTNVASVLLRFRNDDDGEASTRLLYVGLRGTVTDNERRPIHVTYEAQANPADHQTTKVGPDQTGHVL